MEDTISVAAEMMHQRQPSKETNKNVMLKETMMMRSAFVVGSFPNLEG